MNTVACYKVVPDEQDVQIEPDGSLNFNRAERVLGEYDLVAIEEAVALAEKTGGRANLLCVGDEQSVGSKVAKAALSRGADALVAVVGDEAQSLNSYQTAYVLAQAIRNMEDVDVVVCGEGSADAYAQQVGPLVGALLGWPNVNAVSGIEPQDDGSVVVTRSLEKEQEVLRVCLPAVFSVTSDANLPRIPQLRDILAAGKKPVTTQALDDVGELPSGGVETVRVAAPQSVERCGVIYEDASDESIQGFVAHLKAAR